MAQGLTVIRTEWPGEDKALLPVLLNRVSGTLRQAALAPPDNGARASTETLRKVIVNDVPIGDRKGVQGRARGGGGRHVG